MSCNPCNLLEMAKKLFPNGAAAYKSDSTFFQSPHHPRDFAVHPDWVSERLQPKTEQPYPFSARKAVIRVAKSNPTTGKKREQTTSGAARGRTMTRRCATATTDDRDPITWREWY